MKYRLEKVIPTSEQIKLLYIQLEKREHNISHTELPSLAEHAKFIEHNPYRAWFIIKLEDSYAGNVYVQFDNSIGLNCGSEITAPQIEKFLDLIFSQLEPLEAVPSVRYGGFFLNVSSSNVALQNKLCSMGFMESQRTYVKPKT